MTEGAADMLVRVALFLLNRTVTTAQRAEPRSLRVLA